MFERDHIMRQINVFMQALAKAMSLRSEDKQAEAARVLDAAIAQFWEDVEDGTPDLDRIKSLCVSEAGDVTPFAFEIASIMTLKGDMLLESGFVERSIEHYQVASHIYRSALASPPDPLPWDIQERADGLVERLQDAGVDEDPFD